MDLQKLFDSLRPYVLGMKYYNDHPAIDVEFKEHWLLLEHNGIKKIQYKQSKTKYLIVGQTGTEDFNFLLDYVKLVINYNIEAEEKNIFFKQKVEELKKIFNSLPMSKLSTLSFDFSEPKIHTEDGLINEPKEEKDELPVLIKEKIKNKYGCYCDDNQACDKCMEEKSL